MALVKGVHHVALKAANTTEFNRAVNFYKNTLGMPVVRTWKGGIMFGYGEGILEIFDEGKVSSSTGAVHHIGLETDNVDACIAAVRAEGLEVTKEPNDLTIPSTPILPIRMAFCIGPLGEEIEFITIK